MSAFDKIILILVCAQNMKKIGIGPFIRLFVIPLVCHLPEAMRNAYF